MFVSDTYQTPVCTISSWISMNASYMCGVSLLDKCWSVTSLMIRIRQSSSPAALAFITWWLLLGKVVGDVNVTATSGLLGQDSLSWEMSSSTIMGLVMPARDQNRWFKLPWPVNSSWGRFDTPDRLVSFIQDWSTLSQAAVTAWSSRELTPLLLLRDRGSWLSWV